MFLWDSCVDAAASWCVRMCVQVEGACALARGLSANATLTKLELAWNGLDDAGGAAVGEALAANMGLKLLDLSHCR